MAERRLAAGAALLAGLAFLVAGCGGGGSPSAAGTTTTTASRNAAFQAFATCLSQHGVTVPQGSFGRRPTGTTTTPRRPPRTAAEQKAFAACRSKLPSGGAGFARNRGGGGGPQSPAFAKYTQCLKAHGVTFGQTSSQAVFRKAQTACAKLRPALGN